VICRMAASHELFEFYSGIHGEQLPNQFNFMRLSEDYAFAELISNAVSTQSKQHKPYMLRRAL